MIESYLEYNFLSGLHRELLAARGSIVVALKSRPGDIALTGNLKRIEADLLSVDTAIVKIGSVLAQSVSMKHGFTFQWLGRRPEPKSNLVVEK